MKVAVVGATGLVGTILLKVLEEQNFPVTELIPVATEKSVGKEIKYMGKSYKIVSMEEAIAKNRILHFSQPEGIPHCNGHLNSRKWEQWSSIIHQPGEWTPTKN
jgi:aspartate-semialdehyde dehydrogenase